MNKKMIFTAATAALLSLTLIGCGQGAAGGTTGGNNESGVDAPNTDSTYTQWLPAGVEQMMSETEPNAELQQAIANYYEIPEEALADTKYYYNYVDLNGDGTDEILAVVMGMYTSGTGGDSMLWLTPSDNMAVNQAFTQINAPIIITDGSDAGVKDMIVRSFGGGAESKIVRLARTDGQYNTVNDGEEVQDLEGVEGTAIICNDPAADMESGSYLTLASK